MYVRAPAFASRVALLRGPRAPTVRGMHRASPNTINATSYRDIITHGGSRESSPRPRSRPTRHRRDQLPHTYGDAFRGADRRRFCATADSHVVQRPMSGPFPDFESTLASKSSS